MDNIINFNSTQALLKSEHQQECDIATIYINKQLDTYINNGHNYFVIDLRNTKEIVVDIVISELASKYPTIYDAIDCSSQHVHINTIAKRYTPYDLPPRYITDDYSNVHLKSDQVGEHAGVKKIMAFKKLYKNNEIIDVNVSSHSVFLIPLTTMFANRLVTKVDRNNVEHADFYYVDK